MKKAVCFLILCSLIIIFTSCVKQVSVSSLAVVKAIFIDKTSNGDVHVSLVINETELGASTSDIKNVPKIYSAQGSTLESAIKNAEKMQSKTPFYEHNKLLIISENAYDDLSSHLNYFKKEQTDAAKTSVFLTELNYSEFAQLENSAEDFIKTCEGLLQDDEQNKTLQILELDFDEQEKFYGYLPMLKIKENVLLGVDELIVFKSGTAEFSLNKQGVDIMLLLNNKQKNLDITLEKDGQEINIKTHNIFKQYNVDDNGNMKIVFSAQVHNVTSDAQKLYLNELEEALIFANESLADICKTILELTTEKNNDFLNLNWYTLQKEHKYLNNIEVVFNIYP